MAAPRIAFHHKISNFIYGTRARGRATGEIANYENGKERYRINYTESFDTTDKEEYDYALTAIQEFEPLIDSILKDRIRPKGKGK